MEEQTNKVGRPTIYTPELIEKAKEYLSICNDTDEDKENGIKKKVKLPSIGGLAVYLDVARSTLYEWSNEYKEFSDIMERMLSTQEDRLINGGLSGEYTPTITKVILTKHGYREGVDQTTNDKDLPTPIMQIKKEDGIHTNNGNE
jgi:hypothetical protein